MDVREKLVELVGQVQDCGCDVTDVVEMNYVENITLVDHLIANGVTVQEWISVNDERKPNHGDIALCYMTFEEFKILQWDDRSKVWVGDYMDYKFESVAYWQMPQPPKGE